VEDFIRRLLNQLTQLTAELNFEGWAVLVALLLVCGWYFLQGNKIKSV